jgi:hypothetical protein
MRVKGFGSDKGWQAREVEQLLTEHEQQKKQKREEKRKEGSSRQQPEPGDTMASE